MFDDLAIVHMGREALYFAVAWLRTLQQKGLAMSDSASSCFECKRPLTEIDNYGQRLDAIADSPIDVRPPYSMKIFWLS